MALHLGHHLALLSRYSDTRIALVVTDTNNIVGGGISSTTTSPNNAKNDIWKELGIVIVFVVSTVLLIVVPMFVADKKWTYLTYTGLLTHPLLGLFLSYHCQSVWDVPLLMYYTPIVRFPTTNHDKLSNIYLSTGLLGLGGVYIRWKLSRWNTYPPIPIGTFLANILGNCD